MAHKKAASVFPDPVGAQISVLSPRAMAGHPDTWAGVGWPKVVVNHAVVAEVNPTGGIVVSAVAMTTWFHTPGTLKRPVR